MTTNLIVPKNFGYHTYHGNLCNTRLAILYSPAETLHLAQCDIIVLKLAALDEPLLKTPSSQCGRKRGFMACFPRPQSSSSHPIIISTQTPNTIQPRDLGTDISLFEPRTNVQSLPLPLRKEPPNTEQNRTKTKPPLLSSPPDSIKKGPSITTFSPQRYPPQGTYLPTPTRLPRLTISSTQ